MIHARLTVCLAIIAFVATATDALGQLGRPAEGRGGRGGERVRPPANRAAKPAAPDFDSYDQIEYRLMLLEDDLNVRSDQSVLWQAFADKVRAYASDLARERERMNAARSAVSPALSGIQQLERMQDAAQNHALAIEDIVVAARALYATLSEQQKRIADFRIATILAPGIRSAAPPGGAVPLERDGNRSGAP